MNTRGPAGFLRAIAIITLTVPVLAQANNISVTNVVMANAGNGKADITFDLRWENSWRGSWVEGGGAYTVTNWDAAWIFVKFRASGGHWQHGILNTSGHVAGGGAQIELGSDGAGRRVGVFVHRAADGNGALNCPGTKLSWNYAASGLQGTNAVDISVHAVEMVYIPAGPFYAGSGGSEVNAFFAGTNLSQPYLVTSEAAFEVGTNGLNYSPHNGNAGDFAGPVPAGFPKGYNAVYIMKYEVSQRQFVAFLNMLDAGNAASRYPGGYGTYQYSIHYTGTNYACDYPYTACALVNWSDTITYLNWAALRPMTELEYEKAASGPIAPYPNEYTWGDTSVTPLRGLVGTLGSGTEKSDPENANANCGNTFGGAVRVGIFAAATSNRHQAGASYYGVLNLGDNLREFCVSLGTPLGRAFSGENGNGSELVFPGGWPVSGGWGARGGSWNDSPDQTRISDRAYAAAPTDRGFQIGFRGVRSAP